MKEKFLDNSITWIIVALVFLLPLFFLPLTAEFYIFNKQTLLIFSTGVLLALWLVKIATSRTLTFRKTALDLPIILFALAYLIASLLAPANKVIALTAPTGLATVLALTILYFVITNNLPVTGLVPVIVHNTLYAFIASASLLALIAIYQFLGLGETLTSIPWLQNRLFTPSGGPLILVSVLIIGIALSVTIFLKQFGKKGLLASILTGGASIIIAVGLILTIYQLLPGKTTSLVMLSYQDSWAIGIEAFKQNPLFGVSPGNYLSAFNRFRPVAFNNSDFWDVRFGQASSYPLELLTIGGLLVLGTYLFLFIKALGLWLHLRGGAKENAISQHLGGGDERLLLLVGTAIVMIFPWFLGNNLLLLSFSFIFLAMLAIVSGREQAVSFPSKTFSWVALGIGLLLIISSFYFWGRVYAADMAFYQSLNALVENRGTVVYNQQIRAITLNPYNPGYRRAYSQTNFALANSIAGQAELTDQDRANITQLIQQAIREAKVATVLNPTDAVNWENLAQIYRNLINFAQDADQWAIAAYRQAIITDPINPRIRLNFGGLLYGLQDYDAAIRQFQNSVDLKPDFANGYYNLATVYREQEKYQLAYNAMQVVLNLIPIDSPDYQKAKEEADQLAKNLPAPEEATTPAEEGAPVLTEPSPLPSPVIKPPIELPKEAAPEIPEEEASPTPKATPAP